MILIQKFENIICNKGHFVQASMCKLPLLNQTLEMTAPEMDRSSGWLPWSSLETLKASFNVPSDNHDSHPNDLPVSVHAKIYS